MLDCSRVDHRTARIYPDQGVCDQFIIINIIHKNHGNVLILKTAIPNTSLGGLHI